MTTTAHAHTGPASSPVDAASAQRLGIVSARTSRRVAAFAIDVGVLLLLTMLSVAGAASAWHADLTRPSPPLVLVGSLSLVATASLQVLFHGRRGVTAGKAVLRLRSVSADHLGRPGVGRVALRTVVLAAGAIAPIAGPLLLFSSSLWDAEGRGRSILDRIARCWLVDVRVGLDPADTRALRRAQQETLERDEHAEAPAFSLATVADGPRPLLTGQRSPAGVVGLRAASWKTSEACALDTSDALIDGRSIPPAGRYHLVFEDGSVVDVPGLGLIGRSPEAARAQQVDVALSLEDPRCLMSKTHLAFGVDVAGLWICDQGSHNGTVVVDENGVETRLRPGERTGLSTGAVVRIGGRLFQVRSGGATL
mgnify:FL=1